MKPTILQKRVSYSQTPTNMKNRLYILLFFIAPTFWACNDDENALATTCDDIVKIDSDRFQNDASAFFTVLNVSIDDDCMIVEYSSSGCDGNSWVMELIDANAIKESNPIQRDVRLVLENNEACQAVFTREISFDITPLQTDDSNILINIEGFTLSYNY